MNPVYIMIAKQLPKSSSNGETVSSTQTAHSTFKQPQVFLCKLRETHLPIISILLVPQQFTLYFQPFRYFILAGVFSLL